MGEGWKRAVKAARATRKATKKVAKKEPILMSQRSRDQVRAALKHGADSGNGLGMADAQWCAQQLKECDKWSDWDWTVLGMQMGVVG